ncbi:MAG TPA: fatty acid desaturase [Pirellulales bacterium]|jgi:fatty acid desaturase|nr:fatty acid desaturase [Pirellulales bacterium]
MNASGTISDLGFSQDEVASRAVPPPVVSAGDPYQAYRKSLLSPQRVRELSRLRPLRAVIDTFACWGWMIAAWTLVAVHPNWWTVLLAIPIVGTRFYALLIVGHDGIHRRLFRRPRVNDWFADLFVFGPVAAITRINNQNHLGHHRYLSTPDDPDLHQFTCANKYQLPLLVGHLSGVTSLYHSFSNVFLRRGKPSATEETARPPQHYTPRDLALIGGWQISLLVGLSWGIGWWAYPVLWLLPIYVFAFMADNFRAFAEHSQPQSDSLADDHRLITFLSNPVERVFVAPLNMNYHAAHHLWPSIPYYRLAQADREIRNRPAAAGLEWRKSYVGYLLRYVRALPLNDCLPPEQPAH